MDEKQTMEQINQTRRAYFKEWRAKNKEKVKLHNQNYWLNRAKKLVEANTDNANSSLPKAD